MERTNKTMSWSEANKLVWKIYTNSPKCCDDEVFELLTAFEKIQENDGAEDDEVCPQAYIADFVVAVQELYARTKTRIERAEKKLEENELVLTER